MNHAERYEYLVNKMAAIRWRGSDLDASYHAALFLMASHPALFQKMDRYLCPEGIDFGNTFGMKVQLQFIASLFFFEKIQTIVSGI